MEPIRDLGAMPPDSPHPPSTLGASWVLGRQSRREWGCSLPSLAQTLALIPHKGDPPIRCDWAAGRRTWVYL